MNFCQKLGGIILLVVVSNHMNFSMVEWMLLLLSLALLNTRNIERPHYNGRPPVGDPRFELNYRF
jgi:hypothetical protein